MRHKLNPLTCVLIISASCCALEHGQKPSCYHKAERETCGSQNFNAAVQLNHHVKLHRGEDRSLLVHLQSI